MAYLILTVLSGTKKRSRRQRDAAVLLTPRRIGDRRGLEVTTTESALGYRAALR